MASASEAIHSNKEEWIASSLSLLAMTVEETFPTFPAEVPGFPARPRH
jgi:hypothetical protein